MLATLRRFLAPRRTGSTASRRCQPRLEALEARIVPDADYWDATVIPPGQPAAAWNQAGNWSLNQVPGTTQDAIFDANFSTIPCIDSGVVLGNPASVTFAGNLPTGSSDYMLTVASASTLTTPVLNVNARAGCGNELLLQSGATINVLLRQSLDSLKTGRKPKKRPVGYEDEGCRSNNKHNELQGR